MKIGGRVEGTQTSVSSQMKTFVSLFLDHSQSLLAT